MDNILIKAHSLTGIHEFTSSRIIENSVVVDKYAMRGDNLSYGTAIASSLSFVVYEEDPIDWNVIDYVEYFSDDTLLFRGLIEEHTRMDDTRLIECLDPLAELDKPYTSIENNEIFTTNTITASTFITKLLTIGLRDTNTPTWNIVRKFTATTDPQITKFSGDLIELYTMREVLSWALEVLGLIVYCNGADVIIKAPTVNNTVNLNTSVMVDPLEIAEHKMKLTGVLFVKEEKQIIEGKEKFVDVEILSGNTEKGYIVDDNPIILASADKTWTDSIYNRDFALEWTPIKARVSWEIGSKLELLDLINLTDRQGNNYKLLVTSINYTHAGYVLVESVGYNWKKEKIVLGGNKVRYEQSKSRLIEKNTDLIFTQLDNQHKEFTENYQAERQDIIDDVLAVTGTADENKKAISEAKKATEDALLKVNDAKSAADKAVAETEQIKVDIEDLADLSTALSQLDDAQTRITDMETQISEAIGDISADFYGNAPQPPYELHQKWYKTEYTPLADKDTGYESIKNTDNVTLDEFANPGLFICINPKAEGQIFDWNDWKRIATDNSSLLQQIEEGYHYEVTQLEKGYRETLLDYAKTTDLNGLATEEYALTVSQTEAGKVSQVLTDYKKTNDTQIENINGRVETTEGNYTTLTQKVDGEAQKLFDVTQTVEGQTTVIKDLKGETGNMSLVEIRQNINEFSSKFVNMPDNITGTVKIDSVGVPIAPYKKGNIWYKDDYNFKQGYDVIKSTDNITLDEFASAGVWVAIKDSTNGVFNWNDWQRVSADSSFQLSEIYQDINKIALTVQNNDNNTKSQLLQLSNMIDMTVTKDDLIGQINTQAGQVLLRASADRKTSVLNLTSAGTFIETALIESAHIKDAAITTAKVESLSGEKIIANSIAGDKIIADTALINKLVANSVLADNIWSKYINTKYITSDLITSKIASIGSFNISQVLRSQGGTNGAFIQLDGRGTTNFIQAGDNSDGAKFYVAPNGDMVAKSGRIGGWRIADGYLRADGNNNSYVQLDSRASFNSIQIGNSSGTTFIVDSNGNVSLNGKITATSGKIANWEIGTNTLTATATDGTYLQLNSSPNLNFIQVANKDKKVTFSVGPTGDVSLNGKITATSGQIANFNITGNALRSSGGSNGAYLVLNGGGTYNFIQAGDNSGTKFTLSPEGVMSATGANFSGKITALSGKIGGFEISQNYITGPNGMRLSGYSSLNPISVNGSYINGNGYGSFGSGSWGGSHSGTGTFSSGSYTGSVYSGGGTLGGTSYSNDSGLSFSGSIRVGGLSSNGTVRGATVSSSSFTSGVRNGSGQLVTATLNSGGWSISNSDIRLKENIEDLGHEFDNFIYDLPLIKYNYIGDEEMTPQAGVNANYLMKILPEYMAKSFLHQDKNTGLYGAKYEMLVPYLIKTIQDLNNRVKELENA